MQMDLEVVELPHEECERLARIANEREGAQGPIMPGDVAEFAKSLHQWIKEEIRWLGVVVAVNAKGEREVLCSGLHAHAVLTQKGFAALVKKLCEFLQMGWELCAENHYFGTFTQITFPWMDYFRPTPTSA